jgi:glutaminase
MAPAPPDPSPRAGPDAFVSTGSLPGPADVRRLVEEAQRRYRDVPDGALSDVYPALLAADPARFGIAVEAVSGRIFAAGDSAVPFSIMSVAKPFVFALACRDLGADAVRRRIGVNATGLPFNSLAAVERSADGRTNPMVNAGAIATTALVAGEGVESRWARIVGGLSEFAGRPLHLDEDLLRSTATNHRNRALAQLLRGRDALDGAPGEAVELYTRQSCLAVTAEDLAVMGATLADGGVNPRTGERVVDLPTCRAALATMIVAGMYESSGDWLWDIGLPGKSGIGGGMVTVSPGKGALGTYSPLLDGAGNSVRGTLAAAFLSRALGLDLLASAPAPAAGPRDGRTP